MIVTALTMGLEILIGMIVTSITTTSGYPFRLGVSSYIFFPLFIIQLSNLHDMLDVASIVRGKKTA